MEVAGHGSSRARRVVLALNLLDPVLDAMETPQPEPTRPAGKTCNW